MRLVTLLALITRCHSLPYVRRRVHSSTSLYLKEAMRAINGVQIHCSFQTHPLPHHSLVLRYRISLCPMSPLFLRHHPTTSSLLPRQMTPLAPRIPESHCPQPIRQMVPAPKSTLLINRFLLTLRQSFQGVSVQKQSKISQTRLQRQADGEA